MTLDMGGHDGGEVMGTDTLILPFFFRSRLRLT